MSRRRKGVSTILGAAIFVGILVLAFSSFQFFMRDLSALSDSYAKVVQLDEDRRKEILVIDKIALAQLNSTTTNVSASTSSTGATLYPVTNMNFTSNADGWIFSADLYNPETPPSTIVPLTNDDDDCPPQQIPSCDGSNDDKQLDPAQNNGILPTGGFTGGWSDRSVPSQSGAGSIFSHFSLVSGSSSDLGGAVMKWTYKFNLDSTTANAVNDAVFSLGYYIPNEEKLEVKGPAQGGKAVIFYTVTEPNGTVHAIEIDQQSDALSWNRFDISSSRLNPAMPSPWPAGDYKLQITVMVDLQAKKPSDKEVHQFKIHFDDVGIKLNLSTSSARSITANSYDSNYFSPTGFNVGTSTDAISSLEFSIQASSNVSAKQYVFLYDFAQSAWALVSTSSISSSTSNVKIVKQSLDVPRFVAQVAGSYTVDPGVQQTAIVGDVWVRILISAVNSSLTYSATFSLDTQTTQNDKVSFVVSNTGGITAHIVRYWIVTGADITKVDADTYLEPGKSVTLTQTITPTTGTIEIRVITERGSIASLTETV